MIKIYLKKFSGPFFAGIFLTVLFTYWLFPFGDLGDLVSSQVSQATQGQVFVQFDDMDLSLLPTPAIGLMGVSVESPFTPSLSADELKVRPSIAGLINKEPKGELSAMGLLGGQLNVVVKNGSPTENGDPRQRLILSAENLSLQKVHQAMRLPVALEGSLNIETEAQANLDFNEQPEMDLTLLVDKFVLPPATVNTMMGPLALPDMRLSKVQLKGRLSNGKFIIENGSLGAPSDELYGQIKGSWSVTFQKGAGFKPILGSYNLDIDLNTKRTFETKAALFLSFLDSYKSAGNQGSRYRFKVSATNLESPPNITATQ